MRLLFCSGWTNEMKACRALLLAHSLLSVGLPWNVNVDFDLDLSKQKLSK